MDFNQLVTEQIIPLFRERNVQNVEEYKNFFRFQSAFIEVIISYNQLDGAGLFEIGKTGESLYPINDNIVKAIFGSDIKIDQQTKEVFVNNAATFLKREGKVILNNAVDKIEEVRYFVEAESKLYTSQILARQNLKAINQMWDCGNYPEFIRLVEQTSKADLPLSYGLKYKIALKKI